MKFLKDFGAIVAIVIASLGAAVTYGSLSNKVDDMQSLRPQVQQNSNDTAALKQSVQDIKDSLSRIENRLGTK
jgi:hypothetical protein